jgi:hypothetical protein
MVMHYKQDMMVLMCQKDLIATTDPLFYDNYFENVIYDHQDSIPFDRITKVNMPWLIQGTCEETVYECTAPSDDAPWTATCEGKILNTYHVCSEAILVGLGAMPHWRRDNSKHHSYQLMQPVETCPDCICRTTTCPDVNCTALLVAPNNDLMDGCAGKIDGSTRNTLGIVFVTDIGLLFVNLMLFTVIVPVGWKLWGYMKEYKKLTAEIKGQKTADDVILRNLEDEPGGALETTDINMNDSEL